MKTFILFILVVILSNCSNIKQNNPYIPSEKPSFEDTWINYDDHRRYRNVSEFEFDKEYYEQ